MVNKPLKKIIQQEAYLIVFWQLAGVAFLSLCTLVFFGLTKGVSVLLGGLAYGFANLLFVWRVFRFAGSGQMTQFAFTFFIGEMAKLVVSAFLFLMIVKYLPVSLLSVLIGFIGAIISFWLACMWHFSALKTTRNE